MASYYVRSGAAGAGTGADWANAYTTLTAAVSGKAAGDIFYVSEDHNESTAGVVTITSPGSLTSFCFFYCVDHNGTVPPVSADLRTTAQVSTTGNNILSVNGIGYFYGIIFSSGSGANSVNFVVNNTNTSQQIYDSCALRLGGTSGGQLQLGRTNAQVTLNNTTYQVSASGSTIAVAGPTVWRNTPSAITGATLPTNLISGGNTDLNLIMIGVDLSALGSGKTIYGAGSVSGFARLIDCKLGASVTVAGTISGPGRYADLVRCDSGATNYRDERYWLQAIQTVETTIVRTGGATDGTTPISWKIVTTTSAKWVGPFESQPITIWNDSTSAITTLTFYGTTTGGGVPNNDDIWVEVEYLGSASTPLGSFVTTTKSNNLAPSTTTNNSSDGSTWGGGGAGNGFKIVVPSFTPRMKGPLNITIKVAKVSSTYYIDPRPAINGVTVSKSEILAPGVYANELSSGGLVRNPSLAGAAQ